MKITNIDTTLIIAGDNDRKQFDTWKLIELAANICFFGLAQHPTLRPIGDKFEIVAGERRVRAMRDILGRETIPVLIREMSDNEASAIMAAENMARENLNAIEEAQAFQKRLGGGLDISDVAAQVGRSVDFIRGRLKLLALPYEIQHLVSSGQFSLGHASLLDRLDTNRQRIALRYFNKNSQITMTAFRDYINLLAKQQIEEVQANSVLFDISEFEEIVEAPKIRTGKNAITGAPTNFDNLPIVRAGKTQVGMMVDYIQDLLDSGHTQEAHAIGNLYNAMVAQCRIAVPLDNTLSETTQSAGELTPFY